MANLKNADRDELLRRVLTETFEPRFADIKRQIQIELRARLAAEHPVFVKLTKDTNACQYLAIGNVRYFYVTDGTERYPIVFPKYGRAVGMPEGSHHRIDREKYSKVEDWDTLTPADISDFHTSDILLLKAYKNVWSDYESARDKLSLLLYSYTVREKFINDFPEFADYLPPTTTKARLPTVIVKDVRAEFSKLGIPQK